MTKQLQIFTVLALSAAVLSTPIQPDRFNLSNNDGNFGQRTQQSTTIPPRVNSSVVQHVSSTPQEPGTRRVIVGPDPINNHVITVAPPSQHDTIKVLFPPSLQGSEPSPYAHTQNTPPKPLAPPPSFHPSAVHKQYEPQPNQYQPQFKQYQPQPKQFEPQPKQFHQPQFKQYESQQNLVFAPPSHPYHHPGAKPQLSHPAAHPFRVRTHDKRNIMYPSSFENHGFGSFVGYPMETAPVPLYNRYPSFPSYAETYHTFDEPVYSPYPAARVSYTPLPLPLAALARLYLMLASNTSNMFETLRNLFAR